MEECLGILPDLDSLVDEYKRKGGNIEVLDGFTGVKPLPARVEPKKRKKKPAPAPERELVNANWIAVNAGYSSAYILKKTGRLALLPKTNYGTKRKPLFCINDAKESVEIIKKFRGKKIWRIEAAV